MNTPIPVLDFTDLRTADGETDGFDNLNTTQQRLENWSASANTFAFEANATSGLSLNGGTLGGDLTVDATLADVVVTDTLSAHATEARMGMWTAQHLPSVHLYYNDDRFILYTTTDRTVLRREVDGGHTEMEVRDTYFVVNKEMRGPVPTNGAGYVPKSVVDALEARIAALENA